MSENERVRGAVTVFYGRREAGGGCQDPNICVNRMDSLAAEDSRKSLELKLGRQRRLAQCVHETRGTFIDRKGAAILPVTLYSTQARENSLTVYSVVSDENSAARLHLVAGGLRFWQSSIPFSFRDAI